MNLFFFDNFESDSPGSLPTWFTALIGTWRVVSASDIAFTGNNVIENVSHSDGDIFLIDGGSGVLIPATADLVLSYVTKSFDGNGGFTPLIRAADAGTWYGWGLSSSEGNVFFTPYKSVDGVITGLGGAQNSGVAFGGAALHFKIAAIGTTISAKVWVDGSSEPSLYQATVSDSSITVAGYAGFRYAGEGAVSGNSADNITVYGNSSLMGGALGASNVGTTTATITVAAATGGTGPYTYQGYRSTSANFVPQTSNLIAGATGLTFEDTGLRASTSYYYIWITTDSTGAIGWSNAFSITTAAASASGFSISPTVQTINAGAVTAPFSVTLNGMPAASTTIVLSDGGLGGTFSPADLTFTSDTTLTFTYTPVSTLPSRTVVLTGTALGGFSATGTAECVVSNIIATDFTLTPVSQTTAPSLASGDYIVQMNGTLTSSVSVSMSDGGHSGTFMPPSLTFTPNNAGAAQSFTYTPEINASGLSISIKATSSGVLAVSHTSSCIVTSPTAAGTIYNTYIGANSTQFSATYPTGGSGSFSFQWYRSTEVQTIGLPLNGATLESLIDTSCVAGTDYYYSLGYTDTASGLSVFSTQAHVRTLPLTAAEGFGGLGDSILEGAYSTVQTPFSSMIDQINFKLTDRQFVNNVNSAVSGSVSADWLPGASTNYLVNAVTAWNSAGVTRVIVEVGGADAGASYSTSPTTYRSNVQNIINYIRQNLTSLKSIHLVSACFMSDASGTESIRNSNLLIQYADMLAETADNVTVFYKRPLASYNWFQLHPSYQRDGIHPTDLGDQSLGALWAEDMIAGMVGGVSVVSNPSGYSRARLCNE
jgi:lysophospholipase L1-like esterase